MPQAPSTRWCPTPEQLMILEEMYRSGVRTPNAPQIQQITAHLSYYGRIEGKNVFYWFQNHKARERQKLRRRLSRHHQLICGGHYSFPLLPHQPWQCCWQEAPFSPASLHTGTLPHLYQQEETQGLDLLCKLEAGRCEELAETTTMNSSGYRPPFDWLAMMDAGSAVNNDQCCRPLKTLELFPTRSTGLKDECTTSKSSSSSFTN